MSPSERSGSARSSLSPKSNPQSPQRPALALVPPRAVASQARYSPLALWHLLSLDAPCVAAVWTLAISWAVGLHLPWTAPASMFAAVWMLYASDRLLDARPLPGGHAPPELEERHRFHQRHRGYFLPAIVIAACALAALMRGLDPAALRLYTLLAALLGAWLLLIHARPLPGDGAHRLPKELAVGVFFSAAVFIPTVARVPQLRLDLLPDALLLSAVCTLNCLFLYAWEHPGTRRNAHWTTRWATCHLVTLTSITALLSAALLSIALAFAPGPYGRTTVLLAGCTLLTSLLLLLLDSVQPRLKPIHLRALADLVLLTPLLFAPLARTLR